MRHLLQLLRNKTRRMKASNIYDIVKHAFLPLAILCLGTFFIQAEDETVMYIVLFFIVLLVGLVNLLRGLFSPKHRRRGKDGHQGHGSNDGAE